MSLPGMIAGLAGIAVRAAPVAGAGASFAALHRYIAAQIATVPGYMRTLDIQVLAVLGCHQSAAGIAGGLMEIGVHHGKSFLLLVTLRRPDEVVLGVDLFEDDDLNTGRQAGRATALKGNADRLGISLRNAELLRMDSTDLVVEDVARRLGPVRLMHVDGGHGYREVAHDLSLAAGVLHDQGVIVVDDYRNGDWPCVAEATDAFLHATKDRFVPFLITPGKLYVATRAVAAFYADRVREDASLQAAIRSSGIVAGEEVIALKWSRVEAVKRRVYGSRAVADVAGDAA